MVADGGEIDFESGALKINGTSVTPSADELNLLDGSVAGTKVVSKALVVDASGAIDSLDVTGCYKQDGESEYCSVDVTIASAAVKTLNQYCPELVAAPGSGKALVFKEALFYYDYVGAAYDTIATIDELSIKYTNSAGVEVARLEATSFLDQSADEIRIVGPDYIQVHTSESSAAVGEAKEPASNAALCLNMLNSEVATGDGPLKVRTWYKIVPTSF